MRQIIMKGGYLVSVDDDDYDFLSMFSWWPIKSRDLVYANTSMEFNGKQFTIRMHRMIMNEPEGLMVDHKDRNTLNNQKSNLRVCNYSQNNANRKPSGKSKYLGVHWNPTNKKWMAQISKNGRVRRIGAFHSEHFAGLAYNHHAKILHGEFANLNKFDLKEVYETI